jgi:hypothetical protein
VLLLELVFGRPGGRVPLFPKSIDEDVPLLVRLKGEENVPFFGRDDIRDLIVQPVLIGGRKDGLGFLLSSDASGQKCGFFDPS